MTEPNPATNQRPLVERQVQNDPPRVMYLSAENPKDFRRNTRAAFILGVLLHGHDADGADAGRQKAVLLAENMEQVPNIEKALCLGRTAISFGAPRVAIIDLNRAEDEPNELLDYFSELNALGADMVIAAEPDHDPSEHRAAQLVKRMLSSLRVPALVAGRNFVESVVPIDENLARPDAPWINLSTVGDSPLID